MFRKTSGKMLKDYESKVIHHLVFGMRITFCNVMKEVFVGPNRKMMEEVLKCIVGGHDGTKGWEMLSMELKNGVLRYFNVFNRHKNGF